MFKSTSSTVFFFIVLGLFLVVIKAFNISYPVMLMNTNRSTELSVVGEGKVEVVPDTGFVDVGVNVNNASSVEEAQAQINKVNNQIVTEMNKLKVDKKNIKTSNYSIYPNYDYSKESTGTITGYNGNVTVSIKTNDIAVVPQVIEVATKAGANQVQGTRFEVGDPAKYRADARNKAIENAKQQAAELAKNLDIKLGRVVNVVESTSTGGRDMPVMYADRAEGMGGGGSANMEPGSQTITSVVTLFFEKR